jgi:hypothetical protein
MASATMVTAVAAAGAAGAVLRYGVSPRHGRAFSPLACLGRRPLFLALRLIQVSYGRKRVW